MTNPHKLVNTFQTVKKVKIDQTTVKSYLDYLCDAFIVERSMRYDVKGRHYIPGSVLRPYQTPDGQSPYSQQWYADTVDEPDLRAPDG